jgi:hypothetical protein
MVVHQMPKKVASKDIMQFHGDKNTTSAHLGFSTQPLSVLMATILTHRGEEQLEEKIVKAPSEILALGLFDLRDESFHSMLKPLDPFSSMNTSQIFEIQCRHLI